MLIEESDNAEIYDKYNRAIHSCTDPQHYRDATQARISDAMNNITVAQQATC